MKTSRLDRTPWRERRDRDAAPGGPWTVFLLLLFGFFGLFFGAFGGVGFVYGIAAGELWSTVLGLGFVFVAALCILGVARIVLPWDRRRRQRAALSRWRSSF